MVQWWREHCWIIRGRRRFTRHNKGETPLSARWGAALPRRRGVAGIGGGVGGGAEVLVAGGGGGVTARGG